MRRVLCALLVVIAWGLSGAQSLASQGPQPTRLGEVVFRIVADADPVYPLFRISGVAALSADLIAVADESSHIRFFSVAGELVSRIGGEGDGPGEYRSIRWLAQCAPQTITAFDPFARRATVTDLEGLVLRTARLRAPDQNRLASVASCAGPDEYLVAGFRRPGPDGLPPSRPGPYRTAAEAFLLDAEGQPTSRLTELHGWDRYRFETGDGWQPLGRSVHVASNQDYLFVGNATEPMIHAFPRSGEAPFQLVWDVAPRPVTEADVRALIESDIEGARSNGVPETTLRVRRETWESTELPSNFPAYDRVVTDDRGRLWVRRYVGPLDDLAVWDLFSSGLDRIAVLKVPTRFDIRSIGYGLALAVETDDLGLESVVGLRVPEF